MDEEFGDLIQAALGVADEINCDPAEYRLQLLSWIGEINAAIQASEESAG